MIGTVNDMYNLQRVEAGVPATIIDRALSEANVILQQCIGATNYSALDALPSTAPEIAGGTVNGALFEGVAVLVSELTFALLANDRVVLTGFGTVEKADEFSHPTEYFDICKSKEAHFLQGVQRLCRLKSWRYTAPQSTHYTERLL